MLSAVAARRAALVANPEPALPVARPEPAQVTPESRRIPSTSAKTATKRKASAQTPNLPRKSKKKKVAHQKPRYFTEEDAFLKQDDVIIIGEDDSEDSEEDMEGFAQDLLPTTPTRPATLVAKGKRAWSPSRPFQDSSDEEVVAVNTSFTPGTPVTPRAPARVAVIEPAHLVSAFEPVLNKNIFSSSSSELQLGSADVAGKPVTLVVLHPGETLALVGSYTLSVFHGSITMAGVKLEPSTATHPVFAPRSSPVPVIKALRSNGPSGHALPIFLPEIIQPYLSQGCTIIGLQELHTGVQGLGSVCRIFDGVFQPSRWYRNDSTPNLNIPGVHMLTRQHRDVQSFELPPSWDTTLSSVCPGTPQVDDSSKPAFPICLIKGPKKTGKSTFARTVLNRLATRYRKVAFLECDLGQSEFTPGGMVALNIVEQPLFGPPFTHPTIPYLAHYVGSDTPRSSPSHYLAAIQALVQSYKLDLQSPIFDIPDVVGDNRISNTIPLVVNTMGWNKGLGADLTRQIEEMVEPTDVVEVTGPFFERGWFEAHAPDPFGHPSAKKHTIEPIPPSILANNYAPADHRILSMMSYFHAIFPAPSSVDLEQLTATSWNTALPLCAQQPYRLDWSQAIDKFYLTGAGTEDVVPSELERVLNGAIVGLVSCESGAIDTEIDAKPNTIPYSQGATAVSPSMSTCHGIALIRGVSPSSHHMHVLSPLPTEMLAKCRVMIKGEQELPVWGMLDFRSEGGESVAGMERSKVPYLQWGKGEGIGGERRRVRRNLMRKGQS